MTALVVSHYNYWIIIVLMMLGLYAVFATGNLVKRLVGLGVFQTSVFLLYITAGKVRGGVPPILPETHHGGDHGGDAHGSDSHGAGSHGGDSHGAALHSDAGHAAHGAVAGSADGHGSHGASTEAATHGSDHGGMAGEPVQTVYSADALDAVYSNPLPHVLILTAIVVGVATLAVGLALVVRIRDAYGSIEDDELEFQEHDQELADAAPATGGAS